MGDKWFHTKSGRKRAIENCDEVIDTEWEHENESHANLARDYRNVLKAYDTLESDNKKLLVVFECADNLCREKYSPAHGDNSWDSLYTAIRALKKLDL